MKLKYITMVLVVLLTFAFTVGTGAANTNGQTSDDVKEYKEPVIGSDHPLYGLKLALEDVDVAFTFNPNDKLTKKLDHLNERIAEYKAANNKNNVNAAKKALKVYEDESQDIEDSISDSKDKDTEKGLINAYQMIRKHQDVLENISKDSEFIDAHKARLERFAERHHIDVENLTIEDEEHEKLTDSIKIEAKTTSKGNTTVEIEMKFGSSSDTNTTIAREIRNKFLELNKQNITQLIKMENTSENEKLKEQLDAQAEIKKEGTKVEVEYKFSLNEKDKDKIIDAIVAKLTSTTEQNILDVLEIESDEHTGVAATQNEINKEEGKINKEEKEGKHSTKGED